MAKQVDASRRDDLLRRYWWLILLITVTFGAWIAMPSLQDPERAGAWIAAGRSRDSAPESLERVENPEGAAGSPILGKNDESSGASLDTKATKATKENSASPSGASARPAPPAGAGGDTFASALNRLAHAGRRPKEAAPLSATARSAAAPSNAPFSPPRANFGEMKGLSGMNAGSGGSAAGSSSLTPFSSGPNRSPAASVVASSSRLEDKPKIHEGKNQSLNALRGAESRLAAAAASASPEALAGQSNSVFDASGQHSLLQPGSDSQGALIGGMDGFAANLKGNNSALTKKVFTPVGVPKQDLAYQRELAKIQADQQMQTMIIQMVIGGIMGPMLGGSSGGLMGGMMGMGLGSTMKTP